MKYRESEPNEYILFETARDYLHRACEGLGSNGGAMLKIKFEHEPTVKIPHHDDSFDPTMWQDSVYR